MNVWTITDVGAVRPQNQDACRVETLSPQRLLLTVCDGMGGARAGNVASALAVRAFGDAALERLNDPQRAQDDVQTLLRESVEQANQAVFRRASTDPDCLGMGTTLVAALVDDQVCHVANVGDSRAYWIDGQGICQITRDHSLVEDLVQRGEITHEQARTHPQKNLITRALGAGETVKADLFQRPCQPGAFLLLCSDGLSNVVTDQEILYEALHGGEASGCCQRLLATALRRGAPDNVTAILLQM
jgi:protein phosphatase